MTKFFRLLLLLLCLTGAGFAQPTTVRFWHAQRGQRAVLLQRLVERFQKENPDVRVEVRPVVDDTRRLGNDYAALYNALLESLARKQPPDVSQLYENWVTQLAEVDALLPLGADFQEVTADLVPSFLESNRQSDGRLFSLPFSKSVWVLYCNRALLQKSGLQPPRSWEELRQAALKLREANRLPGLVFQPGVDALGHVLLANGGQFLNEQGQPQFASPAGSAALAYWMTLVHDDRSALPTNQPAEFFSQGKACMLLDTTSKIGRFENEPNLDFEVVALPRGSTEKTQMAGTNLGIFRSGDPAREQAAARLLKFLASREVTLLWGEESGYIPVRQSALASAEYQGFLDRHPNHRPGVASLGNAVVQPRVAGWESVRGILDDAFLAALSRQAPPDQALGQAGRSATALLEQIKGQR